jgi:hypothetical protein
MDNVQNCDSYRINIMIVNTDSDKTWWKTVLSHFELTELL